MIKASVSYFQAIGLIILLLSGQILAGPPFQTDDPVPVNFRHGEIYLFSSGVFDRGGKSGIGPALEFNYGILHNTQFHIVSPFAYSFPKNGTSNIGYGDTELGIKYRFVVQTDLLPDIATFPLIEVPTGNFSKGLGNGKAQLYLPVWFQKDAGKWTIYGGGGYWINPGPGNKNWEFSGLLVQYNFTDDLFLGTEIFHKSSSSENSEGYTGLHIGSGIPIVENYQILVSADIGNGITSYKHFAYYFGLYHTF